MVALRLLASVVFATIATSSFIVMLGMYRDGSSELRFSSEVEELAGVIRTLADQDRGAKVLFTITVPPNCELRFENYAIVVIIRGSTKVYQVGVPIFGSPIDGGRVTLVLERTDEGVKVGGEL